MKGKAVQGSSSKKWRWIIVGVILLILSPIIAGSLYVYLSNRTLFHVTDEEVLQTYKLSAEVADLADTLQLTDHGRALLYRSEPQFVDVETFKKACEGRTPGEPWGCYTTNLGGVPKIVLLKIDEEEFADSKYYIAAHELLHAAFFLMSEDEKKEIGRLVEPDYSRRSDDVVLNQTAMSIEYKGLAGVVDEFHSRFGTEYEDLSPQLEAHYKKYFQDRKIVYGLYINSKLGGTLRKLDKLTIEGKALYAKAQSMSVQNAEYNSLVDQYNAKKAEAERLSSELDKYYRLYSGEKLPPQ